MTTNHASSSTAVTEPKAQQGPRNKDDDQRRGKSKRSGRKLIGFSERMEMKRQNRMNKPRNWVEQKLAVGVLIALAVYAWYVYIGRFCVPMLRRDEDALGGRGMGVAFTIVFCVLGLMTWWTYITLLFVAPGFARDFVQKSPAPQSQYQTYGRSAPSASRPRGHDYDSDDNGHSNEDEFIAGTPYSEISPSASASHEGPSSYHQRPFDVEKHADLNVPTVAHRPRESPASRNAAPHSPVRKLSKKRTPVHVTEAAASHERVPHSRKVSHNSGGERNTDETAVAHEESGTASAHPYTRKAGPTSAPNPYAKEYEPPRTAKDVEAGLPPPMDSRRPPLYPMLLPEYRYCQRDGLVKPLRAHHCRVCGTCVLMYDHHCPWIGRCVGAYNHKYFVNFLEWGTPWTLWVFATLLAKEVTTANDPGRHTDPQIIVVIALAAFFFLFTCVLLVTHIRMIVLNQTSVESLGISHIRERDRETLSRTVSSWNCAKRRKVKKEWDREWGELHTEGNIWWLGSARANWEYRMGKNWIGWILPIGKSEGDGLTFPTNPRFDRDGRWRRRHEWPPELQ